MSRKWTDQLRSRSPLVALFLLVVSACRPSTGDTTPPGTARSDTVGSGAAGAALVELRTDRTTYRRGERVTLTLTNRADVRFAFNPCTRVIERESGSGWSAVEEPGRVCTMEAWILEPRATRAGDTELPSALVAGRYRIAVLLARDGQGPPPDNVRATSAPIVVQP